MRRPHPRSTLFPTRRSSDLTTAPLTKDEIKEMQGKLGAAGFTAGPIDGIVGPQTQAALRRYTQARSLPTPEPTQEVLSDRKSTRLNSSHSSISYAAFCLQKK